ncbi:MAG: hypothetical protein IJJ22_00470 [Oscillospiraceae bacterium]|nr:hypothetical protein [Oscillospiraceae bacterium]
MRRPHWIRRPHLFKADEYVCSVCGKISPRPYKACPACKTILGKIKYDPSWVDEAEMMSAVTDEDW